MSIGTTTRVTVVTPGSVVAVAVVVAVGFVVVVVITVRMSLCLLLPPPALIANCVSKTCSLSCVCDRTRSFYAGLV